MNAEQLLQHFERISEAPDAIPLLRRFILDLAVRGMLVEQDSSDEPASELLTQIAAEKAWLVKTGKIRKPKSLVPIHQQPFDPPPGWLWLPLGETGTIQSGNSINAETRNRLEKTEVGYPFIATKDVGYGRDIIVYDNGLKVRFEDQSFKHARAESILICAEGGSAGRKIGISDRDICFGNKLIANAPWSAIAPRLVMYVYMSGFFYEQFVRQMTGVIGGISIQKFLQLPFPLPPLDEQHRIVEKVDELMSLCDQLEAAKAEQEQCRDSLVTASLQGLNQPDEEEETFREHACFTFNNLPKITTRAAHINQLRQTILNLAVRGKLLEQDPNDEPAEDLLMRITDVKKKLVDSKKLKKTKTLNPLEKDDIAFDIPVGWVGARLGTVYDVRDGTHDTPKYCETGYPLITSKNLSSGRLSFEDVKFISEQDHLEISRRSWVERDDILLAMIGSIGNPVIVDTDRPFSVKNVALLKYYCSASSCPSFICLFLNYAAAEMRQLATGGLQPFISLGFLRNYPIALPPLAEQHRIVTKVDELMAICDQLEAQITVTQQDSRRFLESVLADALAPGIDLSAEGQVA